MSPFRAAIRSLGQGTPGSDGSASLNLTNHPALETQKFDWSPDGQQMLFISVPDGGRDIYVMNADGTYQTRVTHTPEKEFQPQWSPTGDKLLFTEGPITDAEVFVVNVER